MTETTSDIERFYGAALVVLRWDERQNKYYVLTSYPEADR